MSQNYGSPSLLSSLRKYRFQKSAITAAAAISGSSYQHPKSFFMRSATNENGAGSSGQSYKRIISQDSASSDDSAQSPAKKPMLIELTPVVKERRMRNMAEMFPEIQSQLIMKVLMKNNWNEEKSRDELLKYDPENQITSYIPPPSKPYNFSKYMLIRKSGQAVPLAQGGKSAGATISANNCGPVVGARKPVSMRGGRARKGSDSDDSDYGVRKGKDDKIYNSDDDDSDAEVPKHLIGDMKQVFEFLNTSNHNELVMLSGCSQKKADAIIALRPFTGWLDMVERFQTSKHLNTDLLNATQELLSTRNNIQKLMKKCTGLAQQLESAILAGAGIRSQPATLSSELKLAPYQLAGLNWLAVLEKQHLNGILADEMGLGKTVQVISFLTHLKEKGTALGPHLIVVPASTLDNWSNEFARWSPSMKVSMYYGNPDERRILRVKYSKEGLKDIDVILTTYTMVNSCPEERKMFRVTPLHYVVYDEAHMLKNMSTQRYDNLIRIKSKQRLLLTGTPLQNNLLELMSLLCFVMPQLFHNKADDLKNLFQKNSKLTRVASKAKDNSEELPLFEQSQITQAKRIMKPFVLRRLKRDVLQDLPKKHDQTVEVPMSDRQSELYKDLFNHFAAKDGVIHATSEQSGISMMMDMRKLANHPLLMRYYYQEDQLRELAKRLAIEPTYKEKNKQYVYEDLLCCSDFQIHQLTQQYECISHLSVPDELIVDSGKMKHLDKELVRLKGDGHRVLLFSQFTMMLDIIEPYLQIRGYNYLRLDGSTAVVERQELIDRYNNEDIFIFLLSTKAGGLGINLTSADTVIIHDIDFNPYNDKQAEDRCHRLGQTRPVTIYRLISSGTIEEGIYQVAKDKLNLERDITGSDETNETEQKNVARLLNTALGLHSK